MRMQPLPQTAAANVSYPAWLPMLSTSGADLNFDAVRRRVLDLGGSAILNCYFGVESFPHPYLAPALASAINQWLQAEWLDGDRRLYGSAVVAPQHTSAAVEEIHRMAADPRVVQITVPVRAAEGYGHERYWPIWEAAAEHDLVVALTYGGAATTPPTPVGWLGSFFEHYAVAPASFQAHVLSLVTSGLFLRLPTLKMALLESGWTWLPAFMWRFDEHWRALHREVPWLHEPPSAYIRRHFRMTTQPVDAPRRSGELRHVLGQMGGVTLLLFGSDYPHDYGDNLEAFLQQLTPDELSQVMYSNACAWYGLPRSRSRGVRYPSAIGGDDRAGDD
jgi:predicted TIM-barrel fold metal-dependent hydrolase